MDFEQSVHGAAQVGDLEKLKEFPFRKLDEPGECGITPLHYAGRGGHIKVCEF
ncbi:hypothetical protein BJ742DRAFT_802834 [Cladochytrium replicatum]|nr:hypothetical protein BJ742DRAFT_802834 [Cladochytrium replicatum]